MTAPVSGPEWWYAFLRTKNVNNIRVWFALGCRESGANPSCLYPAGAPWGDWEHGNGRHFDTGVLQCNDVHLDTLRSIYGPTVDMSLMLDPSKCLEYSQHLAKSGFLDWGLKVSADGQSFVFDWSSYPADWVTKYAKDSEAAFTKWWNEFPKYAAPVPLVPKPVTQVSVPVVKKPMVRVSNIQLGKRNSEVTIVQAALNRFVKSSLVVDGAFGPATQNAYDKYRRTLLGWNGPDSTGSIGIGSLRALGVKAGFTVAP
jgi:hypothetical protein